MACGTLQMHFGALVLIPLVATTMLPVILVRGWHTPAVARNYQCFAGALVVVLYALELCVRVLAERRRAMSPTMWSPLVNVSISDSIVAQINCTDSDPWASAWQEAKRDSEDLSCERGIISGSTLAVQLNFWAFLAIGNLEPKTVAVVTTLMLFLLVTCMHLADVSLAQYGDGAWRTLILFALTSGLAVMLARMRCSANYAKWLTARKFASLAARHNDFLYCLMPPNVAAMSRLPPPDAAAPAAEAAAAHDAQAVTAGTPCGVGGCGGSSGHGAGVRDRGSEVQDVKMYELPAKTYELPDILVMFCSLGKARVLQQSVLFCSLGVHSLSSSAR